MAYLLLVLFFIVCICLTVWFYQKKLSELNHELALVKKETDEEKILFLENNFDEFNRKMKEIKEQRKQKILLTLVKKQLQTRQIASLINVSRTSAFRYLEELEQEGKIEQIGRFGKEVTYQAKK